MEGKIEHNTLGDVFISLGETICQGYNLVIVSLGYNLDLIFQGYNLDMPNNMSRIQFG